MDPVSLVLAAVAAGASAGVTAGVTDVLKSAIHGAYAELKSLLRDAFAGDDEAESALTLFEGDPTAPALVTNFAGQLESHADALSDDVQNASRRVLDSAGPSVEQTGVVATVLQLHADRGGVAVAQNSGLIIGGYHEGPQATSNPS